MTVTGECISVLQLESNSQQQSQALVSDDEQKARKRLRSGETFDNTTLYSTAGAAESPVIVDVSRSRRREVRQARISHRFRVE